MRYFLSPRYFYFVFLFSFSNCTYGALIDFEGIVLPRPTQSSLAAKLLVDPNIQFIGDTINGYGGSIFIAGNNGPSVINSVLTPNYFSPTINAPLGISGVKINFSYDVLSFGFDFQDGNPLGGLMQGSVLNTVDNESFELIIRAYDGLDALIGEATFFNTHTPNGYGKYFSDIWFLGVSSGLDYMRSVEIIFNQGSGTGYAIDNIMLSTESTFVPVPSAVWLFASGLIGLAGLARRKKNVQ